MNRFACLALPMMLFATNFLWPQEPPRNMHEDDVDAVVIAEVKNILDVHYERVAKNPKIGYMASFKLEMTVKSVERSNAVKVKVGDIILVSGRRITETPEPLSLFRGQTFRAFRVPVKGGRGYVVREDSEFNMSIPAMQKRIQEALAKLAKGEIEAKDFSVTYSDINKFHGGLRLTIHGDGEVEQESLRQQVGQPKKVSADDMKRLVEVLNKHQAWEQRTAHRLFQPGESTAVLVIRYQHDSVTMWEIHGEMAKNDRLIAIREEMKRVAWKEVSK